MNDPQDPHHPPMGTPLALVHWAFPPTVGGVESHLWDYSQLLSRSGYPVTVFTGTSCPDQPPGVEVLHHPSLDLETEAASPKARRNLHDWFGSQLRQRGIRLVHGHNLHHFAEAPAMALLDLRSELDLVLLHSYHSIWEERDHPAAEAVKQWDGHFTISDFLRRDCERVLGIATTRTYLGIDTARFVEVPPLGRPDAAEPATILLPARLIPDKGAELAVQALHHIVSSGLCPEVTPRLLLTETPDCVDFHHEKDGFRGRLTRLIESCGLTGQVDFERAGVADMPALYARARVVVYPSNFAEPMGLAPLEAMCAARPVVVSRMGGLDEGVSQDCEVGYVVPDRDHHKLADRIAELLNTPDRARKMGLKGRDHVRAHFDLRQSYLKPMLKEYERALRADGGQQKCLTRKVADGMSSDAMSVTFVDRLPAVR